VAAGRVSTFRIFVKGGLMKREMLIGTVGSEADEGHFYDGVV